MTTINRTLIYQGDCLKPKSILVEINCFTEDGQVVIDYAITPDNPDDEKLINRCQLECRLNTEFKLNGALKPSGMV